MIVELRDRRREAVWYRVSVHEIEFVVEEHERKVDGVDGHADDADVLEYEEEDVGEVHVPYTRHRRAGH